MSLLFVAFASVVAHAAVPEKVVPMLNCVKEAEATIGTESPIHDHESALKLCQGASSDAPKTCAETAKKSFRTSEYGIALSDLDILNLCNGASSDAPVDCAKAASKYIPQANQPIKTVADITFLCHHATDSTAVDCVEQMKSEAKNILGSPMLNLSDVLVACTAK